MFYLPLVQIHDQANIAVNMSQVVCILPLYRNDEVTGSRLVLANGTPLSVVETPGQIMACIPAP